MQGVDQSTLLPFIRTTAQRNKGIGAYDKIFLKIDEETTAKIGQYAQRASYNDKHSDAGSLVISFASLYRKQ